MLAFLSWCTGYLSSTNGGVFFWSSTDVRDAAAKAIYGRVFSWLITKINNLLAPEAERQEVKNTIGILGKRGMG
jgi:hypothetical protein